MVAGTGILLVAGAAPARADQQLIAKVPFEFTAGRTQLPAGEYIVTQTDNPAVVSVANANGSAFAFVLTIASDKQETPATPELVFERFAGHNFLARIETGVDDGRDIPMNPSTMSREVDRVAATWLDRNLR